MIDVSEVETYRDGGTIEFRLSGSIVDGLYRLQTPALGFPQPLFCDGVKLQVGSHEEAEVLSALKVWLKESITPSDAAALSELAATNPWHNLPERLSDVLPLYYVRRVAERLQQRNAQ